MAGLTTPHSEKLLNLVDNSLSGRLLIPEFQRSFVWGNQDIKDLLVSILNGFYIGTFLMLRRSDTYDFEIRYLEGIKDVNSNLPAIPDAGASDKVILDGQQRLTAIIYASTAPKFTKPRYAGYPHRYFLKIHDRIDSGKDWDDCVLSISENDSTRNILIIEENKSYSFKELIKKHNDYYGLLKNDYFKNYCYKNGWIPFTSMRSPSDLDGWLDYYVAFHNWDVKIAHEKKQNIKKELVNWNGCEVPTLTLEGRPFHEVAEIFERINRTGVVLSTFALATAVYFKNKINLREWWQQYYDENELIRYYCERDNEEYPKIILQVIALCQGKEVRKKVLINSKDLSIDKNKWDEGCRLLTKALERIQNCHGGYGVFNPNYLPYKTMIVPLSAILKNCKSSVDYKKIDNWYWSSIIVERYAGSSDSVIKQDYDQLVGWLVDDSRVPQVVYEARSSITQLCSKKYRGGIYKAILNIIAIKGARDFYDNQSIQLHMLEDHHIFPKGNYQGSENINSILNRTLISKDTNRSISDSKTSIYLKNMETKASGVNSIKMILKTHLIDDEALTAMLNDDFIE